MTKRNKRPGEGFKRFLFTLPPDLIDDLNRFALICRGGNKSWFVADAIRTYITALKRHGGHPSRRQASKDTLQDVDLWNHIGEEAWQRLGADANRGQGDNNF